MDNKVVIYGANGRKICEIEPYQSYWDYLKTTEIGPSNGFGYMSVKHKIPVWNNSEAIVLWAWKQAVSFADEKMIGIIEPFTCIICGNRSIKFKRVPLRKKLILGIFCSNCDCKMHNVLIPSEVLAANRDDVPWDKIG
jgi:hypothetical protein